MNTASGSGGWLYSHNLLCNIVYMVVELVVSWDLQHLPAAVTPASLPRGELGVCIWIQSAYVTEALTYVPSPVKLPASQDPAA